MRINKLWGQNKRLKQSDRDGLPTPHPFPPSHVSWESEGTSVSYVGTHTLFCLRGIPSSSHQESSGWALLWVWPSSVGSAFSCMFSHEARLPVIPGGLQVTSAETQSLGLHLVLLKLLPTHSGATCVPVCMSGLVLSGVLSRAENSHYWQQLLTPFNWS